MPKWTDEQQEAIENRGQNLLISAAAGSGKTAVLVERIVNLAINGEADIDKMMIVTFTRAAAGEMRERILEAFNNKIAEPNSNSEIIKRQINLIGKSMIATIHSFCTSILRNYFYEVELDPNFRVLETMEAGIMKQEALEEVLEEEYEKQSEDFIKLIEMFTGDRDDSEIENIIMRTHSFIQSQPEPYKWLSKKVEKFNMTESELENSDWYNIVMESMKMKIENAADMLKSAMKVAEMLDGPEPYLDNLIPEYEAVENVLEIFSEIENSDIDRLDNAGDINSFSDKKFSQQSVINALDFIEFKRLKTAKKTDYSEDLIELSKGYRDSAKKEIEDLKKNIEDIDIQNQTEILNRMYGPMKYLSEIIEKFDNRYSEKKAERGSLDFNDLEHKTLKILENEDIQESLRERFDYIFVDEYQDSNIVQETIVNRIKREDNLFLVGDVKQSIYRFRLADPTLFVDKYKRFSKDSDREKLYYQNSTSESSDERENCLNSLNKRIDLAKNFRSRADVLEWTNFIFKNIMSEKLGEIEYDESAYLYTGADYENEYDTRTEVNIVESDEIEDADDYINELRKEEVEAKLIAEKIKELKKLKTYDAKKREYRNVENKDIVILMRSIKNRADKYEEILLNEDIPVYTDADKGYFTAVEVKVFLNLLNIIDNKRQDIPLISTMKSFVGGFSLEELSDIRLFSKEGYFYDAVFKYIEENEDELSLKLKEFLDRISNWKKMSRFYKLDEFIWKVMIESDYYYYVGSLNNGKQRQANLELLVDKANEIEKTSVSGLFNFLRFSDRIKDIDSDMGAAKILGENENVVRIMSIHKSKGLEFPFVICAGLGNLFNTRDTRSNLLFHKDLGVGIDYVDIEERYKMSTISKRAIIEKIRIETLSEEMRILYVAMTRAKDKLILFGTVKDASKIIDTDRFMSQENSQDISQDNSPEISNGKVSRKESSIPLSKLLSARSFIDWIAMSIESDTSYKNYIVNIRGREDVSIAEKAKDIRKENLKKIIEESKTSDVKESIYIDRLNWKYPFADETEMQSRFGVTAFLANEDNKSRIEETVELPKFMEEDREPTAAEIGTSVHAILENLSFRKDWTKEELILEAEKLVARELITEYEFERINFDSIISFFESELYDRIKNSDNIRKEQSFVYKISDIGGDIYLQGTIDCSFEEDGELVLLDYKTDRSTSDRYFNEMYSEQLKLYEEAMEDITKKKVKEKYIYALFTGKLIKVV